MPEVAESVVDVEPKDRRTSAWKEWKRRQAPEASAPAPEALNPTMLDTIEGRAGLPVDDKSTPITPDMGQDEIVALVAKAQAFAAGNTRREAHSKVTRFESGIQAVTVARPTPTPAAPAVPTLAPIKPTMRGEVMDFVEFSNRRFAQMDKPAVDAVMNSSTPHPAFAVTRKLYVAYVFAVRNAALAEAAAQAGQMD